MSLLVCIAVWFVLHAFQFSGGEVFPIEEIENLWGPKTDQYQYAVLNDYLQSNDRNSLKDPLLYQNDNPVCNKDTRVDDKEDIKWFDDCIVKVYGFSKNKDYNSWDKQGDFAGKIDKPAFKKAADRASAFFKINKDWSASKKKFQPLDLLYITAARYLLVTYVLWEQSERKIIPCSENDKKQISIPASVCYPQPYGSATYTSDYDVGLVGKDAGTLTEKFNQYFQREFGVPSENVFDTNVYAFTLEYAIPKKFTGFPNDFVKSLGEDEGKYRFKMQELVNAYYKVFKYEEKFYTELIQSARTLFGKVKPLKDDLDAWDNKVKEYKKKVSLRRAGRLEHNNEYQTLVKSISSSGGFANPTKNLDTLSIALLYAAEAYHTRGAIRFVVGSLQMKMSDYDANNLRNMDLWVSLIENWGESIKEYKHSCAGSVKLEICVLKMSKYMWRMVSAMKHLKGRIEAHKKQLPKGPHFGNPLPQSLVSFAKVSANPEVIMRNWYRNYKLTGKPEIQTSQLDLSAFFNALGCAGVVLGKPLQEGCLAKINTRIDEYNQWMADILMYNRDKAIKAGKKT